MTQRGYPPRGGRFGGHGGRGSGGFERSDRQEQLAEITAPYGFVPLGPVVEPPWLQRATEVPFLHDVPFEDGLCGTFDVVVEAETPICVAGRSDERERRPCRIGSTYAIPGSGLRGALRNVVEIASFSRMTLVNDHRYAVRDLQNRELYLGHMADMLTNLRTHKKEPMPLVNAGWLEKPKVGEAEGDDSPAIIRPCHFGKIEYAHLQDEARKRGISGFNPGEKQSSVDKYKKWGDKSLEIQTQITLARMPQPPQIISEFGKIDGQGKSIHGTLVFTGQPNRHDPERKSKGKGAGNAKHHDFVFYGEVTKKIRISKKAFADFEFAHADRGQQHRMQDAPNAEWKYWKDRFERGGRVPVFFLLTKDGEFRAMGLAMMFRLSYAFSIHDVLERSGHSPKAPGLDLAEGLFGTVRKLTTKKTLTLRGRVQIGHAYAQGAPKEEPSRQVVLGAPKASYYPNYVTQSGPNGRAATTRDGKPLYETYMSEGSRLRGWKRYHAQQRPTQQVHPRNVNLANVGTTFRPLAAGTRFTATVNIHNLRPAELGALLWAIDFGGDAGARHTLGLARPLGYGRCRLHVTNWRVRRLIDGEDADQGAAVTAFTSFMEAQLGGQWAASHAIHELIALAQPKDPDSVRYQRLDSEARINEFADAKKPGLGLALKAWAQGAVPRLALSGELEPRGGRSKASQSQVPEVARAAPPRAPPPKWRRGDRLEVELLQLNKKGKWQSEAIHFDAKGTIEGSPPADAEKGKVYSVEVVVGSDPKNLNLKWP